MSIYHNFLLKLKEENLGFTINLNKKTLNKKNVELNTEDDKFINNDDLKEYGIEDCLQDCYATIEILYKAFKYSTPSEKIKKSYFKALDVDELSDYDLVYGMNRRQAQACLEGFILFATLSGDLIWKNQEHWFYQGEDKELILLKKWIEKGESENGNE